MPEVSRWEAVTTSPLQFKNTNVTGRKSPAKLFAPQVEVFKAQLVGEVMATFQKHAESSAFRCAVQTSNYSTVQVRFIAASYSSVSKIFASKGPSE